MVKWEYSMLGPVGGNTAHKLMLELLGKMNEAGEQRYELVSFHAGYAIFKRPVEPSLEEQAEMMRMCCERKE